VPTQLASYTISELSKVAAGRAVEALRYSDIEDGDWADSELDYWKGTLEEMGFQNPKIRYSGFSSQGDGASFTSAYVDLGMFLVAVGDAQRFRLLTLAEKLEFELRLVVKEVGEGRYSHKYTVRASIEDFIRCDQKGLRDRVDDLIDELEERTTEVVREMSDKIYAGLDKEYTYLVSDDAVVENIAARGYLFTEGGARVEGVSA